MSGLGALLSPDDPRPLYFVGVVILFLPFPLMGLYGLKNGYSIYYGWIRICYGAKAKFWNVLWFWIYAGTLLLVAVVFVYKGPDV